MIISSFKEKVNRKAVMCLGSFDSIHLGHRRIIDKAISLKDKYGASSCVLTYYNDLSSITKKTKGLVFTFDERIKRLEKIGVDEVCACKFTEEFANQSPCEFLSAIVDNRPIGAFICGSDFKFGKFAKGDVAFLKDFCKERNIDVYICNFAKDKNGDKISTTEIKELLEKGEIEEANYLLGDKYFISGIVEKGRQMGRTIGFPTANISVDDSKLMIKNGVYATTVYIDGVKKRGITNVGKAPTFNFEKVVTECFIDDFNGNLYGKKLTIYFDSFIRDIKQFSSVDELKTQLTNDLKVIR